MSETSKQFVFSLALEREQTETLLDFLDAVEEEIYGGKTIRNFTPTGWPDASEFLEAQIDDGHLNFTWREEEIDDERSRIWLEPDGEANIPLLANVLALAVEHFNLDGPLAIRWTSSSDEPDMAPVHAGIALIYRDAIAQRVGTLHQSMDDLMMTMLNDYQHSLIGQASVLKKNGLAIDENDAEKRLRLIDRALAGIQNLANEDGFTLNDAVTRNDDETENTPAEP